MHLLPRLLSIYIISSNAFNWNYVFSRLNSLQLTLTRPWGGLIRTAMDRLTSESFWSVCLWWPCATTARRQARAKMMMNKKKETSGKSKYEGVQNLSVKWFIFKSERDWIKTKKVQLCLLIYLCVTITVCTYICIWGSISWHFDTCDWLTTTAEPRT